MVHNQEGVRCVPVDSTLCVAGCRRRHCKEEGSRIDVVAWLAFLGKIAWGSYKARSDGPRRRTTRTKESATTDDETLPMHQAPERDHSFTHRTTLHGAYPEPFAGPTDAEGQTSGRAWRNVPVTVDASEARKDDLRASVAFNLASGHTAQVPLSSSSSPGATRASYRLPSHSFSHLTSSRPSPTSPPPPITHTPTRMASPTPLALPQPGISRTMILATSAPDDPCKLALFLCIKCRI